MDQIIVNKQCHWLTTSVLFEFVVPGKSLFKVSFDVVQSDVFLFEVLKGWRLLKRIPVNKIATVDAVEKKCTIFTLSIPLNCSTSWLTAHCRHFDRRLTLPKSTLSRNNERTCFFQYRWKVSVRQKSRHAKCKPTSITANKHTQMHMFDICICMYLFVEICFQMHLYARCSFVGYKECVDLNVALVDLYLNVSICICMYLFVFVCLAGNLLKQNKTHKRKKTHSWAWQLIQRLKETREKSHSEFAFCRWSLTQNKVFVTFFFKFLCSVSIPLYLSSILFAYKCCSFWYKDALDFKIQVSLSTELF